MMQSSTSCLGEFSISAQLDISCDVNGSFSIAKDYIPNSSQPSAKAAIAISVPSFPENDKCRSKVSLSNIAGVVTSKGQNFSEYVCMYVCVYVCIYG